MTGPALALNVGSSSVKFALFASEDGGVRPLLRGQVETAGAAPRFRARDGAGRALADAAWPKAEGASPGLFEHLLAWIEARPEAQGLAAVGHRIVHGAGFSGPARLDAEAVRALRALCPLAPLHQPQGLAAVAAVSRLRPQLVQTASFDTAFHAGHASVVTRFALPREYEARGVRRYGFHGLSYAWLSARLAALDPELAAGRVVAAHLGAGASLCALLDGRSVDTTMGFSALDGLVMATRCGAIDPGVLLYLQDHEGLDSAALSDLLYHRSGLVGVSGLSGDMRTLLQSDSPAAAEAVELFAFRAAREIGALAMSLGGLDGVVFSGGVGEHAPAVRAMICAHLRWMGAALDADANGRGGERRISAPESALRLWTIPTDEEAVIARETFQVLTQG